MPFIVSTDKSKIDLEYVHRFLSKEAFWSLGRKKETVVKSIENSLCFSVFENDSTQIGFARVITDYSTFAYLSDVFIDEDFRGNGLSKKLMKSILDHPELSDINRWMLLTKDAHGLYSQFGFRDTTKKDWIMEKVFTEI